MRKAMRKTSRQAARSDEEARRLLGYVEEMTAELSEKTAEQGFNTLSFVLEMARLEAFKAFSALSADE
jgi:hypothetical protein